MSMAILDQVSATPDERRTYMKRATALRRAMGQAVEGEEPVPADEPEEWGVILELIRSSMAKNKTRFSRLASTIRGVS